MRLTPRVKNKLEKLIGEKLISILGEDGGGVDITVPFGCATRIVSKWTSYLESVGCRRVHKNKIKHGKHFVMLKDPLWHGDQIIIPREVMMKVLFFDELPTRYQKK